MLAHGKLPACSQVAQLNVPYILMHMRGDPSTMQSLTQYTDTCLEVGQEMQMQAQAVMDAGVEPWRIILDPGAYCLHPFQFTPYTLGHAVLPHPAVHPTLV